MNVGDHLDQPPRRRWLRPERWDVTALRAGVAVCVVFAVPLQTLAVLLTSGDDDDASPLGTLLFFGTLIGFVLGAGCAAWLQRLGLPLSHGLATAVGTYLAAQAVLIVLELVTGDDVNWFAVLSGASLAAAAGLIGGFLGRRLRARGVLPSTERTGPGIGGAP